MIKLTDKGYYIDAKTKEPVTVLGSGYRLDDRRKKIPISIPDKDRSGHLLWVATTRQGKTRVIENICEQDIKKGYSVAFIDPKCDSDALNKIVETAKKTGREKELIFINPFYPQLSAPFNVLRYFFIPEELAGIVTSGVEAGKDPFFQKIAYEISIVACIALVTLAEYEGKKAVINLNDVKNIIPQESLKQLQQNVASIDRNRAYEMAERIDDIYNLLEAGQLSGDLQRIASSPQDYFAKVTTSLRVALTEMCVGSIGRIVGKAIENPCIKRLEQGERVILVLQLGSLTGGQASFNLAKIIFSSFSKFAGRKFLSGEVINPPLSTIIDECQSVLYRGIDDSLAKVGGANWWISLFCQDPSQVWGALGKDYGNVIFGNTNTRGFQRCPNTETAEYASDHFGTVDVFSPILSIGGSPTVRETEKPRVKPDVFTDLQPQQFYLKTYSGNYRGKTSMVSPANLEIQYPKINVL
ncbi:MAG TPA: conjugal transfer protein TraG [Nitrospiraceae bacterium]|nr:conjugal transfer protein TraG [Nitrospiraceae bacterium]